MAATMNKIILGTHQTGIRNPSGLKLWLTTQLAAKYMQFIPAQDVPGSTPSIYMMDAPHGVIYFCLCLNHTVDLHIVFLHNVEKV